MAERALTSCIYHGWVRHRRFAPSTHRFQYKVFMMYIDLSELSDVLSKSPLWSTKRWALARFKRSDYFGDAQQDLHLAVRQLVNRELGLNLNGAVHMLSNFRYFGFIINPLSVYYCFDEARALRAMVLEVTNTPWGKSHCYVLPCDPNEKKQRISFTKALHVSPFHPINMTYKLCCTTPRDTLALHLENWTDENNEGCVFDATLGLQREEITGAALNRILIAYPFMTLKVFFGIYWQAMKLYFKKVPVFKYGELRQE